VKKGFSLIEVVFAIVIISISMMSIPMLLSQADKSNTFSLIQETILAGKSKMGNILSYRWDDNSYDSIYKLLRVLTVANGHNDFKRVSTLPLKTRDNNLRIGHIYQDKRRRFHDELNITSPTGTYTHANKLSIDDFHAETITKLVSSGTYDGKFDYKDSNITMTSNIYYIDDNTVSYKNNKNITFNLVPNTSFPITSAHTTNIKMIELSITTGKMDQTFVLRSFSTNIGQSTLFSRSY